jgi:hypothetical protein
MTTAVSVADPLRPRTRSRSPSRRRPADRLGGRGLKKVPTATPHTAPYLESVWQVRHWRCVSTIKEIDLELITCITVCCGRVVAGRRNGTLSVWDPASCELVTTLRPGHDGEVVFASPARFDTVLVTVGGSSIKVCACGAVVFAWAWVFVVRTFSLDYLAIFTLLLLTFKWFPPYSLLELTRPPYRSGPPKSGGASTRPWPLLWLTTPRPQASLPTTTSW